MVESQKSILVQLREYDLCSYCLARQTGHARKRHVQKCYICRGLFDRLDEIAVKAHDSMRPYQFDTFLVGATLPMQLFEREDALRARLKIRGKESIKSQLTRELGRLLAKMTRRHVNFSRPDLNVCITVDKDGSIDTMTHARHITFKGRYTKKIRGLSQRQERCPLCHGSGCKLCNNTGLYDTNSIEAVLAKHYVKETGGKAPRFSWVGSEDQNSLVLGRGRPFYVRISDPRTRTPKKKRFSEGGVTATITDILDDIPALPARFVVTTRISCTCARSVTRTDLVKLRSLAGTDAKFESRSKVSSKRIHSVKAKKTSDREFTLTVKADGGLPIKQFVGGQQYMDPNISTLLDSKCECITFDILSVDIQDGS